MLTVAARYHGLVQPPGARMILARPSRCGEVDAAARRAFGEGPMAITVTGSFVGQSFPMGSVGDHRCAGSSAPAHYWADVHAPPAVIV